MPEEYEFLRRVREEAELDDNSVWVPIALLGSLATNNSPGLQKERAERFAIHLTEESHGPGLSGGEKITREALEEEARRISIKGNRTPEEQFWQRQRGASETIQIGRSLISE
ncbi:hypothetical protein B0T24DRAFT_668221 [Lasiosphaeria ovina]|uniref:Uncharacterized protein n=1 Tax=Lasiosphaeria ovina TaxID=92902 RepID=A0AAE0K8Q4_9PEZI|nr:hypothetical protein B0T24DRAFT_668221 [Lasiosphaeria ovina]